MYAARIAFSAVEMVVERVAAAALLPRAQRSAAVLARVARHVEALVQSHDANRFFSATLGNYRLAATSASGGISKNNKELYKKKENNNYILILQFVCN